MMFEEGILCSCSCHLAMMLKYQDLGLTESALAHYKENFMKISSSPSLEGCASFMTICLTGLVMPRFSRLQSLCLNWYDGY